MDEQQPGQVIVPQAQQPVSPVSSPAQPQQQPQQVAANAPPTPVQAPIATQPQPPQTEPVQLPPAPDPVMSPEEPNINEAVEEDKYKLPEQLSGVVSAYATTEQPVNNPEGDISWTASEYIAHNKTLSWYAMLFAAALALTVAVYFITGKDIISAIVIPVVAIIFAVYAGRQPKVQQYIISGQGFSIGDKFYAFNDFKSFSVIDEGAFSSISFMPLKRFMPTISIYYDPNDEAAIADALALHLPYDERKVDLVDRMMRRIRF